MGQAVRFIVAIGLALQGFCWAQSDPPGPGSGVNSGKPSGNAQQAQEKSAPVNYGTEASPAVVKLIPAEPTEQEARKAKYEADEKPALDRWTVAIAAASMAVNVCLAWVTFWLWRDARQASLSSDKHTRDSLSIAKEAAYAAKLSAETALTAQRAWVGSDEINESENGLKLYIKNFGVNPARTRTMACIGVMHDHRPVEFLVGAAPDPRWHSTSILYSGARTHIPSPLPTLDAFGWHQVEIGALILIAQVRVNYLDIVTGREHETLISYQRDTAGSWKFTADFNEST